MDTLTVAVVEIVAGTDLASLVPVGSRRLELPAGGVLAALEGRSRTAAVDDRRVEASAWWAVVAVMRQGRVAEIGRALMEQYWADMASRR